jgi:hypothetical protein
MKNKRIDAFFELIMAVSNDGSSLIDAIRIDAFIIQGCQQVKDEVSIRRFEEACIQRDTIVFLSIEGGQQEYEHRNPHRFDQTNATRDDRLHQITKLGTQWYIYM